MAALDGLRALAVLAVIALHAEALPGGWLGVEVFFVLSGYLITTLMLAEVERTNTVALKAFWGRRVRRLWPGICAYLLVTLVIIVPRAVSVTPPTTRHLVATLTWRENWQMIGDGGYGAGQHAGVVEHFWSLSIEEQFYFVWPVVVWAVARWVGRRGVRAAAAAGAVVSLALVVWGVSRGWSVDRLYLGSDTRVLGLCVGALFAGVRPTGRLAATGAGVGAVAIVACCWWFGDIRTDILAGPLQVFTALSVLTIVCSARLRRGPFVWRPMRAIGRWSFGIYLWHVPIGMIVRTHVGDVVGGVLDRPHRHRRRRRLVPPGRAAGAQACAGGPGDRPLAHRGCSGLRGRRCGGGAAGLPPSGGPAARRDPGGRFHDRARERAQRGDPRRLRCRSRRRAS